MARLFASLVLCGMFAVGCAGSDGAGDIDALTGPLQTCLANDPDCADGADAGAADPLPAAVALSDPDDPNALLPITFGGFFYSDGETSQLCSTLAESFPPQCGSLVIDIEAPLEIVLQHVAESFGSLEDAKINIDQGVYWTDDWVNVSGTLQANRLVLE